MNFTITSHVDCDDKDPLRKDRRMLSFKVFSQELILADCLKVLLIILLLGSSILMYRYEPSQSLSLDNYRNMNLSASSLDDTPENNPYGFHPFYQVHKRVEYKNPAVNLCQGIDPKRTLLLTILSRASNVHIREAIRQTWGAIRTYNDIEVRILFLVGVDDGMLRQIEIEQHIYHGKLPSIEHVDICQVQSILLLCMIRCDTSQSTGKLSCRILQRTSCIMLESIFLSVDSIFFQG
jgi:hypothetical protein